MPDLVFLLDVDNTLLANDGVKKDYDTALQSEMGPALTKHFWTLYEQVREERSVVDIPLTLKRLREQTSLTELDEETYRHVCSIFNNYPFAQALYPQTLETLHYLDTLGLSVIVSDGDMVFQARKISASGLAAAVDGRVLLYIHKQERLDDIMKNYPADHYVMIDDKPQILADFKKMLRNKVTTVFVQQGQYATNQHPSDFTPDITLQQIADLQNYTAEQFFGKQ